MKKKILILSALLFVSSVKLLGQNPTTNWEKVFEDSEQTIYVDTSTIKLVENQISLLSAKYYKRPQKISSLNKEAGSVKSQLLFNTASRKFTVIGTLYYDTSLKILGETSLPGFASGSDNFSAFIEGNEIMTALYNKAVEYLKSGLPLMANKPLSKSTFNENRAISEPDTDAANDSLKALEKISRYLSRRDSIQKTEEQSDPLLAKISEIPAEVPASQTEAVQTPVTQKKNSTDEKRDIQPESGVETNPKSTIFKIGSKYSFQVSSWPGKAKAESEVARYKRKGDPAFLSEGVVRGKTWYRVRVGYFNSLEETEQYMKKMK